MKYIPQSADDRRELLSAIGASSAQELFKDIPAPLRLPEKLDYPRAQSEIEIRQSFQSIVSQGRSPSLSFAGAGIYHHDIPSIVPYVQSRSEFATSYTPYQPEISQGTLQCIFEFQTLACQLTQMELSNASLYDGATSLGEAVLMALRILKKSSGKILLAASIHPHYKQVVKNYCELFIDRFQEVPEVSGRIDLAALESALEKGGDILITQSPNIFGAIEDYPRIAALVKKHSAFWITSTMEPLSWGLLKGPGAFGAEVATAEGQSFGNAPYLGGSSFGIFCTKNDYLRNLPGRLVGETLDENGARSYTLTFATREQFIRRGRATSNICTNNNLNMLAGLIHLVTLGKQGIRELAKANLSKCEYVKSECRKLFGASVLEAPSFNEFSINTKIPAAHLVRASAQEGWVCGVDLGELDSAWKHRLLIHVSELHQKPQLEKLLHFLKKAGAA